MALTIEKQGSQRKPFILIAEDDEDDRMFFEEALRQSGEHADFKFVENGQELIKVLKDHHSLPDLIFLDLNMPVMDGREALKVIRSDPKITGIPVSCFGTSCRTEDHNFSLKYEATLHEKPVSVSEFSALVESEIRRAMTRERLS